MKVKTHHISVPGNDQMPGVVALEKVLARDGFIRIESQIVGGMSTFEQHYWVHPEKPATVIVITHTVLYMQIEAVHENAKKFLMEYLHKSEKELEEPTAT